MLYGRVAGGSPVLYGSVASERGMLYGNVAVGDCRALRQCGVLVLRPDRAVLYGSVAAATSSPPLGPRSFVSRPHPPLHDTAPPSRRPSFTAAQLYGALAAPGNGLHGDGATPGNAAANYNQSASLALELRN